MYMLCRASPALPPLGCCFQMELNQPDVGDLLGIADGVEAPFRAQWNILGHIKFVQKPFKNITDTLSAATATLMNVITVVGLFKKKMPDFHQNQTVAPEVQAHLTRLEKQIGSSLELLLGNPLYNLATFCDPKVKVSITRATLPWAPWSRN